MKQQSSVGRLPVRRAAWFDAFGASSVPLAGALVLTLVASVSIGLATEGTQPNRQAAGQPKMLSSEEHVDQALSASAPPRQVELEGEIVCLTETLAKLHALQLAANHQHLWALRTERGRYYPLLHTRLGEALFLDERLRHKKLALEGRLFPTGQALAVERIQELRDGIRYDIYYYCDVCAIRSVSPAPCDCCRGPVRLVVEKARDQRR